MLMKHRWFTSLACAFWQMRCQNLMQQPLNLNFSHFRYYKVPSDKVYLKRWLDIIGEKKNILICHKFCRHVDLIRMYADGEKHWLNRDDNKQLKKLEDYVREFNRRETVEVRLPTDSNLQQEEIHKISKYGLKDYTYPILFIRKLYLNSGELVWYIRRWFPKWNIDYMSTSNFA